MYTVHLILTKPKIGKQVICLTGRVLLHTHINVTQQTRVFITLEYIAPTCRVHTCSQGCSTLSMLRVALAGRGSGRTACQPRAAVI